MCSRKFPDTLIDALAAGSHVIDYSDRRKEGMKNWFSRKLIYTSQPSSFIKDRQQYILVRATEKKTFLLKIVFFLKQAAGV